MERDLQRMVRLFGANIVPLTFIDPASVSSAPLRGSTANREASPLPDSPLRMTQKMQNAECKMWVRDGQAFTCLHTDGNAW